MKVYISEPQIRQMFVDENLACFLTIQHSKKKTKKKKTHYHISSVIRLIIFLPKQCQRSRSVFKDGSRSLALFRNGKICIIAKFHRTDLVI